MNKKKIFFIYALESTFILNDIKILKDKFDVRCLNLTPYRSTMRKLVYALKILLDIIRGTIWADVTYSWFADIHALFAVIFSKIFKKKSIVVVGGYEVVKAPEIGYGGMLNPIKAKMIRFILRYADKILAVSISNMKEILRWTKRDIHLIYNLVDCEKYKPQGFKERLVITVGTVNKLTLKRKGIETFVKAARYLPDIPFVVIGKWEDNSVEYLKSIAPKNVSFTGYLPEEELIKWYRRAKVYCQLSFYESFGVSLAEAMACGCIPVVTSKGAIPEVVGDCGFYVPYWDEKEAAKAIEKALNASKKLEIKARRRIERLFSKEKRKIKLEKLVREVTM